MAAIDDALRPPATVRFTLALVAFAAIRSLASVQPDPAGAAESAFLALLVGGVLAGMATLAAAGRELGGTALLATAAVWVVGHGPQRGALVTVVLVAGLALAVTRAGHESVLGSPGASAGFALGLQLLLRPDLLLPPLADPRTLVSVLALPAACGVALHLLAVRRGAGPAWVAGAGAVVLAPGWNVTVTLGLGALAAGVVAADQEAPRWLRIAAAAALLVPPIWDPGLGLLFTLGALTFLVEGRLSWLVSMAAIAVLVWTPMARTGADVLALWAFFPALVPGLVGAAAEGRPLALRGAYLALVAAIVGGGPEALAGGLALAALGMPREGDVARLQHAWSNVLALLVTALAAYPWLRAEALDAAFDLLGLATPGRAAAAALVGMSALGLLLGFARRQWPRLEAPWAPVAVVAIAFLSLLDAVPGTALVPIRFEPVALGAAQPRFTERFPAREVRSGVLDCHLVRGDGLEPGTRVATVRLRGPGNELLGSWDVLAGFHTAEWAAARPDVAGRPGFAAPRPWLTQLAADGTFFAHRFRTRFHLPEAADATTVAVRRDPALPDDVVLVVYRLELRR